MKKCIIFASHIPSVDRLYVGKEFLDKFVELYKEYDIYVGINNSCKEWYVLLNSYKDRISIFYDTTPEELLIDSDASAFQTALRLLKSINKRYSIYWFGHTKGATSEGHDIRASLFKLFWDKKDIIEDKILNEGFSIYAPVVGKFTPPNYLNETLPIFINGNLNDDIMSFYTFWVHSAEVIDSWLAQANPEFYTKRLTEFRDITNKFNLDRYFFERDFPMIYQKIAKTPKLLYYAILEKGIVGEREYIENNFTKIIF